MSFSNIVKHGERDVSIFTYTCGVCKKVKHEKPWMMYNDDDRRLNICSYICYNKCQKIEWNNILNKSDFNTLFPIVDKTDDFELLDKQEVQNMNKSQYESYILKVEEYFMMNPQRYREYIDSLWENEVVEKQDTERDTLHVESY